MSYTGLSRRAPFVGALQVSGNDAEAFLQRILTGDLGQLEPGMGQINCSCSVQGRVIANFYLWRLGATSYMLLPPPEMTDFLQQHLATYVLRADVQLECMEYEWSAWIGGPPPTRFQAGAPENILTQPYTGMEQGERLLLRFSGEEPRFLYAIGPDITVRTPPEQPDSKAHNLTPEQWALLDVEAGLPWIGTESSGQFLPQMLYLEKFKAMALDKGCYPGQEVINRLQHQGVLKHRLYRVRSEEDLESGWKLLDGEGTAAGRMLNCAPTETGWVGLAVVKIGAESLHPMDILEQELFIEEPIPKGPAGDATAR